jgi:hypothetical protein
LKNRAGHSGRLVTLTINIFYVPSNNKKEKNFAPSMEKKKDGEKNKNKKGAREKE